MFERYKQTIAAVTTETRVEIRPVVITISLTPEQQAIIQRTTGQCPTQLDLTANELQVILTPGPGFFRFK